MNEYIKPWKHQNTIDWERYAQGEIDEKPELLSNEERRKIEREEERKRFDHAVSLREELEAEIYRLNIKLNVVTDHINEYLDSFE